MDNVKNMFKRLLKSRSLRYGTNSIILTAVVIAIAVVVNLLVNATGMKFDLTPNKLYTIGDKTKEVLKDLNKDVTIYGLFDESKINTEYDKVVEFLNQYDKYDKINVEYIDPDKNPSFINELDPDNVKQIQKGDFIVKSGDKFKQLTTSDLFAQEFDQQTFQYRVTGSTAEQAFTGAIKYVSADTTPAVYFTEGHSEKDYTTEYKYLSQTLERNNFDVKGINISTVDKIPEDAQMLIIIDPKTDITEDERQKIDDYFTNGGNAIFLFDSPSSAVELTRFEEVLEKYNISLDYDIVAENDQNMFIKGQPSQLIPEIVSNSINSALDTDKFKMLLSKSRSVNILKNTKDWLESTSLIRTSDKAVGQQVDKSVQDIEGVMDLAVAVENKGGKAVSKIIVMGDSDFISDSMIENQTQNGLYFFFNSLSWIYQMKDDVYIAAKTYETKTLEMTALQSNLTALSVVIVLPLLILGFGIYVWMRRRHL